jgi:hypothetical protein
MFNVKSKSWVLYLAVAATLGAGVGEAVTARRGEGQRSDAGSRARVTVGHETILVLIGSSVCTFSKTQAVRDAFAHIVSQVRQQLRAAQDSMFSVVGVAVDWRAEDGLQYLRQFKQLDEVMAGRSWLGTGVDRYVREFNGDFRVPQILLLEREIAAPNAHTLTVTNERVVLRLQGTAAVMAWAQAGAPITSLMSRRADTKASY